MATFGTKNVHSAVLIFFYRITPNPTNKSTIISQEDSKFKTIYSKLDKIIADEDEKVIFDDSISTSFLKNFIMFTGEFEFGDIPLKSWHHKIYLLIFAFLCVVVMLNVLTGVAIIEVDLIRKQAQILAVKSQLNIIHHTESFLLSVCPSLYNGFYEKAGLANDNSILGKQCWKEIELYITPNNYQTCCTSILQTSNSDVCCNYYYHFYCRFWATACVSPFAPCLQKPRSGSCKTE